MSVSHSKASSFMKIHSKHGGHGGVVLVTIKQAKGSTPRDEDAFMLVSETAFCGTIGGGQLEFLALEHGREILHGVGEDTLELALGPKLNQCCGGHVELCFSKMDNDAKTSLLERLAKTEASYPWIYIFGAGHVGLALYHALLPLPFQVKLIDNRPNLPNLPDGIATEILALPESAIKDAPQGSSFIILTHDHALDFILAKTALLRKDAPYVGMIGSKTKREIFKRDYIEEGGKLLEFDRLICPMGKSRQTHNRKMPEVIAAQIVNEVIDAMI